MIYQVEGDILLSKAQAIAHGVRINDPMHKGLAFLACIKRTHSLT